MRKHAPEDIIGEDRSVNCLVSAADWMTETVHIVDPIILKVLKLCIRIRSRVAKSSFRGGDTGHKYFLEVLVYCYTTLILLPKAESHVI